MTRLRRPHRSRIVRSCSRARRALTRVAALDCPVAYAPVLEEASFRGRRCLEAFICCSVLKLALLGLISFIRIHRLRSR